MIEGLSHITFVVRDLDAMTRFLAMIFDAQEVYSSGDKIFSIAREKFFLINGVWIAIMEGDPHSERTYSHIAFKISKGDFDKYTNRVRSLGVEIRESRPRLDGEGSSLYFYDYDNHLFELHTGTLEQRLAKHNQAD
jgi:catechol 2,3-dioxygenase-like lactoylglutathione lyase family enzyme